MIDRLTLLRVVGAPMSEGGRLAGAWGGRGHGGGGGRRPGRQDAQGRREHGYGRGAARDQSRRSRSRSRSPGRREADSEDEQVDEFGRIIQKRSQEPAKKEEEMTEEEQMQMMLGFGGFGSTKGKVVEENNQGAARGAIASSGTREYRQYMNRVGGFGRALDKQKKTKKLMK